MIIYRAENKKNGKNYIGQTNKTLDYRKAQHVNSKNNKHTKNYVFSRAIKKYGVDGFNWSIIDTAKDQDELDRKEIHWIEYYDSMIDNKNGYNMKGGGAGGLHSELTKYKISKAQKGELNHMYGKKGSQNGASRRVIDVNSKIEYECVAECAEILKLSASKVAAVARGVRAHTVGYIFRYLDENGDIIEPENAKQIKPKKKIRNIDTGEEFDTLAEAGRAYGLNPTNLGNLLRGNKKNSSQSTFAGCKWEYFFN